MHGEKRITSRTERTLLAAVIALCAAALILGCFSADFNAYDDSAHIASPPYANVKSAWEYFIPKEETTYIPLAFLSYKADKFIWSGWFTKLYGSWAPGVRLDNWLLHVCSAIFLWRLLVSLAISEWSSFFIALIFACHPLACETVAWVSERKNVLAGFFGFWALYVMLGKHRQIWRWPAVCVLYACALMGKPSVLGLLPVFIGLEFATSSPSWRKRLGLDPLPDQPQKTTNLASIAGAIMLCVIAAVCVKFNLYTHGNELITPPGGTIFTALLTDLNIFSRYLFNIVFPIGLSASYLVEPITGLGDSRTWIWGAALFGTFAATMLLAHNRWRAALGWAWFFCALATNANVIAISHIMCDRYIYISTPGFLIVLSEVLAGIGARQSESKPLLSWRAASGSIAALFVLMCLVLSVNRSYVWRSSVDVFTDAVAKQPRSFFAHYGLAGSYDTIFRNAPPNSVQRKQYEAASVREFHIALEECPDASRFAFKNDVGMILGMHYFMIGDAANAEKYLLIGEATPVGITRENTRAICLAFLSAIDLSRNNLPQAFQRAQLSVKMFPTDPGRIAIAKASLAISKTLPPDERRARLDAAQANLNDIAKDSPFRFEADELLKEIQKQ